MNPFADASALATYRVCELAREDVTVALSGDGADEAFRGLSPLQIPGGGGARARARPGVDPGEPVRHARAHTIPKADWAPRPLRAKTTLLALAEDGAEGYARSVGVTTPTLRAALFSDAARSALGGHRAEDRYVRSMRDAPARDALDRAQYADFQHWLPGDILTKADRTSMAVSLEAREPLLDYRLVEFAAKLPVGMRLKGGQGKWLLKKSMERYLPKDILYRPKMGFVTPISAWFRGPLANEAAALAKSRVLIGTGWFDPATIVCLAEDHRTGRADHGRTLWQLVMLERSMARLFG